jgi:hypothetical protein
MVENVNVSVHWTLVLYEENRAESDQNNGHLLRKISKT